MERLNRICEIKTVQEGLKIMTDFVRFSGYQGAADPYVRINLYSGCERQNIDQNIQLQLI